MKKIVAASLVLALFSCKKEDKAVELTKENLSGNYKQTAETTNSVNTWDTNNYEACEMDNVVMLKTDNTYTATDAGTTCSPSADGSGTWNIDGKTFTMDGENLNVESFDGKTLVLKQSGSFMGTNISVVSTYTKQ